MGGCAYLFSCKNVGPQFDFAKGPFPNILSNYVVPDRSRLTAPRPSGLICLLRRGRLPSGLVGCGLGGGRAVRGRVGLVALLLNVACLLGEGFIHFEINNYYPEYHLI